MTPQKAPLDALSRPIEVGDIITYPGRKRSSMWTNIGVVRRIESGEDGSPILYVDRPVELHTSLHNEHGELLGYDANFRFRLVKLTANTQRVTVVDKMTLQRFVKIAKIGQTEKIRYANTPGEV
jgi:hypothetical protein